MNNEPRELHKEGLKENFLRQYPAVRARYNKLREHALSTVLSPKSNFMDLTENAMQALELNHESLVTEGELLFDIEEITKRMQAVQDYLDLLEKDPAVFGAELTEEGVFPDIRAEMDRQVEQSEKAGERFDRFAYYMGELKKRLDKIA